jgi:hypothetical protein
MVCMLVCLPAITQAQTFTLGQPLTAVWTGAANEADAAVTVYQVRVDSGTWTPSGQTVPQAEYRYSIPQNLLTVGAHTIAIRGCAGTVCGTDEAQVTISVGRPLPGRPRTPSVVPTPSMAISFRHAEDIAQAYGFLALDRKLTNQELNGLVVRHGGTPPTRESVFAVLDAAFVELAKQ